MSSSSANQRRRHDFTTPPKFVNSVYLTSVDVFYQFKDSSTPSWIKLGFHFDSKNAWKIFEDCARHSVFFRTEVKPRHFQNVKKKSTKKPQNELNWTDLVSPSSPPFCFFLLGTLPHQVRGLKRAVGVRPGIMREGGGVNWRIYATKKSPKTTLLAGN